MDKRLRGYNTAISLNLILWSSVFFFHGLPFLIGVQPLSSIDMVGSWSIAGTLLAAVLQHWVYYDFSNPKTRITASRPSHAEEKSTD